MMTPPHWRDLDFDERARDTVTPPRYHATNKVHVSGTGIRPARPYFWKGRQWAVTPRGVECRDGDYPIEWDRLWEDDEYYGWVPHMREKGWVDMNDFVEALRLARRHFGACVTA
jgi:hypothetical protein